MSSVNKTIEKLGKIIDDLEEGRLSSFNMTKLLTNNNMKEEIWTKLMNNQSKFLIKVGNKHFTISERNKPTILAILGGEEVEDGNVRGSDRKIVEYLRDANNIELVPINKVKQKIGNSQLLIDSDDEEEDEPEQTTNQFLKSKGYKVIGITGYKRAVKIEQWLYANYASSDEKKEQSLLLKAYREELAKRGKNVSGITTASPSAYSKQGDWWYATNADSWARGRWRREVRKLQNQNRPKPSGSWFPYFCKIPIDLTRYDIHTDESTIDNSKNCLMVALESYGLDKATLSGVKCFVKDRVVPQKDLADVAKKIKHNIKMFIPKKNQLGSSTYVKPKNAPYEKTIDLCCLEKHYFIKEKLRVNISKYCIDNWDKLCLLNNPYSIVGERQTKKGLTYERDKSKCINNSYDLVKYLLKSNVLVKRKVNLALLESQFYREATEFETLEYNEEENTLCNTDLREDKFEGKERIPPVAEYLFDYETVASQTLPNKGKLGIKVWDINWSNKKVHRHEEFCVAWRKLTENNVPTNAAITFAGTRNYELAEKEAFKTAKTREEMKKLDKSNVWKGRDITYLFLSSIARKHFPNGGDIGRKSTEKLRIIAHNAGYDVRFIRPMLKNYESIDRGSKLITGKGTFYYKRVDEDGIEYGKQISCLIEIRDSYGLITAPLSSFGKLFPNITQEKEIMPYSFYTPENVWYNDDEPFIETMERVLKSDELLAKEDKDQFIANIERWGCDKNNKLNIVKYAKEYCKIDVEVLNQGLLSYNKSINLISKENEFNYPPLIATDYMTIPSLVFDLLLMNGCMDDTYRISGIPQQYIQNCVVGGKCMLKENIPQYFTAKTITKNDKEFLRHLGKEIALQDYDAVSCYTSAFARSNGMVRGVPKPIKGSKYEEAFKNSTKDLSLLGDVIGKNGAFYCRVIITKIGKRRKFPVMSLMVDGKRDWDDSERVLNKPIYTDHLSLEDWINFQEVEFEIIDGYYFDEGYNTKVIDFMKKLFSMRIVSKNELQVFKKGEKDPIKTFQLDYKTPNLANKTDVLLHNLKLELEEQYPKSDYYIQKYKNPIEVVYKLLMNCCYGKMLLKEIESESEYVPVVKWKCVKGKWEVNNEWEKYFNRNYNTIKSFVPLPNAENPIEYKVDKWKTINDHFNNVHQGVQVLAYAKRLMNEVICLAEDIGLEILYTDTDSIHIVDEDIPILEEKFVERYNGRVLRGEDLGQFNPDFDTHKIKTGVKSVKFIGLAKKCYIDVLNGYDKNGELTTEYHIRLKGVPNESILREANRRQITPEELYDLLWEEYRVSFDLLKKSNNTIKVRFIFNDDWTITNETNFSRSLIFNNDRKKEKTNLFIKGSYKNLEGDWGVKNSEFKDYQNYNNLMLNIQTEVELL